MHGECGVTHKSPTHSHESRPQPQPAIGCTGNMLACPHANHRRGTARGGAARA